MLERLKKLEKLNKNIKIAVLGAGKMGKAIFYQCSITPGIDCVAISDIILDRAIDSVKSTGQDYQFVENQNELHDCINKNDVAICEDGMILADCEHIDAFVDASNSIRVAGLIDQKILENNTHLIMMNAEADLLYGPHFLDIAKKNGIVYTCSDGDQPGVIKRIVDSINLWGFELVMLGNIKGFLDRYSNPTKIIPEADKRELNYEMCTAFTDGTKVAIEMALLANALNCSVLEPGMNGKKISSVYEIFNYYDFEHLYQNNERIVEYTLGTKPTGGVFVVAYCDNEYQQNLLNYYSSGTCGNGRFNLFYRPYHLCHIETISTVVEAVLDKRSLLNPKFGFRTNVYAYAKKNINKGEILDGIGGYTCYGLIENNEIDEPNNGLPICLANNIIITRDINKDEKICMSDIMIESNRSDFTLYNKAKSVITK